MGVLLEGEWWKIFCRGGGVNPISVFMMTLTFYHCSYCGMVSLIREAV